ncbi:ISL3 family transposase [Nocardia sp. NPDC004168]|uniref:ISL3 family transposase n=1 Tax=Nocardia sp. NPDC004168 TaxID=3154452 RepID=UPI0033BE33E5
MFSGSSALVIDEVVEEGWKLVVRARTAPGPAVCSRCGEESEKVHSYHHRTVADLPADGRMVIVRVRVRRLVCPTPQCWRTFREQVPGLLERYQRRTTRLTGQVRAIVKELAGRAAVGVLAALPVRLSRHTAVRILLAIPLPHGPVPRVVSVDDFALRRRNHYGTAVIDAVTHQRIDVLADRKSETLETWLRNNPGVEVVVRDGSATYAEAIRRARPAALQVSDRWHLCPRPGRIGEGSRRRPRPMLGRGRPETANTHSRDHHVGTLACGARSARPRCRTAGLRPAYGPGVEHGETLRPRIRAGPAAPPTVLPGLPCRPLPRPLAAASHRTARCPGPSPVPRDQSARLHRRPEPAAQISQPRARRERPHLPLTASADFVDHEPADRSSLRTPRSSGRTCRGMSRDDRPGSARRRVRSES